MLTQVTIKEDSDKHSLEVMWKNAAHVATLKANVEDMTFEVIATKEDEEDGGLYAYRCFSSFKLRSYSVVRG